MGPRLPIDISMPIFVGMPAFPGDPEFRMDPLRRIERGDPYSLTALSLGSHTGTHVDPPCHFIEGGATIDAVDLGALNGPCQVVEVPEDAERIGPEVAEAVPAGTERVLFRTANSDRWAERLRFFRDFVGLDAAAAVRLRERGVRLVGLDALSIENDPAARFPVHHELLGHGVLILEGILLAEAPRGRYRLDCLPLRLRAGDGGPARAVLTPE
jgi:arylformamidase